MTARCASCRRQVQVRADGRLAVHYVTLPAHYLTEPVSARAVRLLGAGSVKRRCSGSEREATTQPSP